MLLAGQHGALSNIFMHYFQFLTGRLAKALADILFVLQKDATCSVSCPEWVRNGSISSGRLRPRSQYPSSDWLLLGSAIDSWRQEKI